MAAPFGVALSSALGDDRDPQTESCFEGSASAYGNAISGDVTGEHFVRGEFGKGAVSVGVYFERESATRSKDGWPV